MAMSTSFRGCLVVLGGIVLIVLLGVAIEEVPPWARRTFGPKPTPIPTLTAQQLAQKAEAQRIAAQRALVEKRQRDAQEAAWPRTKAGRIWQQHKDWDRDDCETIASGKVRIGMTAAQCREAWGRPNDTNRTTYSFGTHEQWCYGEYCKPALYFDNGILQSIQD